MFTRKKLSKEEVEGRRLCFAIIGCHKMGYDAVEAADLLKLNIFQVYTIYKLIDENRINFNSK